jgi:hypothetical protein
MESDLSRKGRRMQSLITAQIESGNSVSVFCRSHRIAPAKFWWWKRRLRDFKRPGSGLPDKMLPFVRVLPELASGLNHYELSLGDGRILRLPGGFPVPSLIQIVLGTVRQ